MRDKPRGVRGGQSPPNLSFTFWGLLLESTKVCPFLPSLCLLFILMYCIIVHCRHFFLADYKQYTQRLSTFRGLNINIWGMIIVQMGDDYRTNGGLNINIWGMGWRSCPSPSMLQVRAVRHRPVATLTSGGGSKATSPDAPKHHYQHLGDGIAKLSQPLDATSLCLWHGPVAPSLSYKWG